MNQTQIKEMQQRIGTTPDGFWGPASVAACQRHLRKLMPSPNPWPATDQRSLANFFGLPGDGGRLTDLDVRGLGLAYDGRPVRTVCCHQKVAASLHTVLRGIRDWQEATPGAPDILGSYDGCYNNRKMRGGSLPSLHARGAAVDFWASMNGNRSHWPAMSLMPLEVMEIFAREGWLAAGAFWARDAMHFQATR
jgi:hypothetical protein